MSIKITSNLKSVLNKSIPTAEEIRVGVDTTLHALGQKLVFDAKSSMDEEKTGRIYKIKDISGQYTDIQASAPGEALKNRTGEAKESINYIVVPNDGLYFGSSSSVVAYWEVLAKNDDAIRPTLKLSLDKNAHLFKTYYLNYVQNHPTKGR